METWEKSGERRRARLRFCSVIVGRAREEGGIGEIGRRKTRMRFGRSENGGTIGREF